jgi:hypothetical protein
MGSENHMNDLVIGAMISPTLYAPDFQAIRQLTRAEAGTRLKAILTSLVGAEEHALDTIFHVRLQCFRMVRELETWKDDVDPEMDRPFKSLDRWTECFFPDQPRYAKAAKAADESLAGVPMETINKISVSNLMLLSSPGVSEKVRTKPDVLQTAQTSTKRGLLDYLNENHHQRLEHAEPSIVPASVNHIQQEAITMAMALEEDCNSEKKAIEAIFAFYVRDNATLYYNWLEDKKV